MSLGRDKLRRQRLDHGQRCSKQTMGSYALISIGLCFIVVGFAVPIINFLIEHPWAVSVLVGCAFMVVGSSALLWEHGVLPLFPAVVAEALMHKSLYSLVMELHQLSVLLHKDTMVDLLQSTAPGMKHWLRLLMLCVLNIEDDKLVREILDGMDPGFRYKVFTPGLVNLVPAKTRRILVGQVGAQELAQSANDFVYGRYAEMSPRSLQVAENSEIEVVAEEVLRRGREVRKGSPRKLPQQASTDDIVAKAKPKPLGLTLLRYYADKTQRYGGSLRLVRLAIRICKMPSQIHQGVKFYTTILRRKLW